MIFERARFNLRNQREGESVEQYITALYQLIETCNYKQLTDEMLRDRLVVGIRDTALSERLQDKYRASSVGEPTHLAQTRALLEEPAVTNVTARATSAPSAFPRQLDTLKPFKSRT